MIWFISGICAVALLGWLGLQIQPMPFRMLKASSPHLETIPLPNNLPIPVRRYYQTLYGNHVPIIHSAVLTGRATMKLFGLDFPARFRFVHQAGQAYRHYFEVTFFLIPIFKVNEHFVDGQASLELPIGTQTGSNINQAANLALWAETMSFPAVFITNPNVHWQTLDDTSAVLVVPYKDQLEHFIARFDQKTGLLNTLEAMRYREVKDTQKQLWIARSLDWTILEGQPTPRIGTATWLDQGRPWASFQTEQLQLNTDVAEYVRASGI